jgi:hypothetical protein
MRDVLAGFYGVLKGCDAWLRMVFLTGVSKFARVSIFSGLNQLKDLTLHPAAAEVCGYTESELETRLGEAVDELARKTGSSPAEVRDDLRRMYDGYWWGSGERVYNPWSVLNALDCGELRGFWFASGTPGMLVDLVREQAAAPEDFDGREVGESALDAFDIGRMDLTALLWQTGYLTIRDVARGGAGALRYTLAYPNLEVRTAWFERLFDLYVPQGSTRARGEADALVAALVAADRGAFERRLAALYASIPHQLHLPREAYYHSLFHLTLSLMGATIVSEYSTAKGRVDAVVETRARIYIVEFKLGTADEALAQIERREYAEPWRGAGKAVTLLGVGGFGARALECRWKDLP